MEHGIAVRQRLHWLRYALPDILANQAGTLSPRMMRILEDLSQDWRYLDERIVMVTAEIDALAKEAHDCRNLMTVPDIGLMISSATVAAIENGKHSREGVTLLPGWDWFPGNERRAENPGC